jgi:hypothetical protein
VAVETWSWLTPSRDRGITRAAAGSEPRRVFRSDLPQRGLGRACNSWDYSPRRVWAGHAIRGTTRHDGSGPGMQFVGLLATTGLGRALVGGTAYRLLQRGRIHSAAIVCSTRMPSLRACRLLTPCRRSYSKLGTSTILSFARAARMFIRVSTSKPLQ